MANEKPARFITDVGQEDSFGYLDYFCAVGNDVFGAGGASKGALRFTNIDIDVSESINMAELKYVYSSVGVTSGSWKHKCYGIDEDNTADFSSNPFGRSKTSASVTTNEGAPTSGGTKTFNVKDIMQEIVNRGGWSRNNALGFIIEDDGSSTEVYAIADEANSYLVYRIGAEPNFFPTPVTIAVPTFPAADDYGMKISFPGHEVLAAAEADLLFTTRKEVLKIKAEAQTACTGGVEKLIAHGLAYKPEVYCFVRKDNFSFELPRLYWGAGDPVTSGVQGYFSVDSTYLRILTFTDADVYYYILLDEQA